MLTGTLLVSCVPDQVDPRVAGKSGFKPRPIQQTDPVSGKPLTPESPAPPSESDKNPWQKPKVTWPKAGEGEAELDAPVAAKGRSAAVDGRTHDLEHAPIDGLPVKVAPLTGIPRSAAEKDANTSEPAGTSESGSAEKPKAPETPDPKASEEAKDPKDPKASEEAKDAKDPTDPKDPKDPTDATEPEAPVSEAPESRDVTGGAPQKLHVKVTDRKAAAKAGIDGVLIGVSRSDGQNKPGRASVQLDYNSFKHAYGAGWASRLQLVELPACVLTTPDKPSCKGIKPLQTHNNTKTGILTAQIDIAPDKGAKAPGAREATVLAATAAPEGSGGDFKATSLSPSGKWTAGGSDGGFSWAYEMKLPPVPGELSPKLDFRYDSNSIDGRTASSNSQPSWIGEGWSMEMGFIERQYMSCKDDNGTGSNAPKKTGDTCWKSDNAVMSLNGQHSALVKDDTTGAWKLQHDDGSRIEHLNGNGTDTNNGDDDNEYWKVTTPDGTQYFFGKNRLPGWSSGKPETNSTLSVPVFGNHAGEPGHGGSFADSVKDQGWRWSLDYVVDPHHNAMALFYEKEKNVYAKNSMNLTTTPKGTASYDRANHLNRVEYGHRAGQVFSANPAGKVNFGTSDRCLATGDGCKFDKAHADNWPDTPVDQFCEMGKECLNSSPTFWSKKRLTSVTTQVLKDGVYQDVDNWAFGQDFPGVGDAGGNGLFLNSITRTGKAGGTPVTMPKVEFGGTLMANRLDSAEGIPPLNKYRISRISNETGADTLVDYSPQECKAGATPAPDATNTKRCYPIWWTPTGAPDPVKDWFHKYVVTKVTEDDKVGGAESAVTEYEYLGGMAWAKDTSAFIPEKHRAYSDFRGYGKVRTRIGIENKTLSESTYLRGIEGAKVTDSHGDTVTDAPQYTGMELELANYDKDGGQISESAVNKPWTRQTASQARPGTTDLLAYQSGHLTETDHTRLSGNTWRTKRSANSFDEYGQVIQTSDEGDTGVSGDEVCTRTTFVTPDKSNWMIKYPAAVQRASAVCSTPASAGNVLSEVRTSYDSKAYGTAPVFGQANPTKVEELERFDADKPVFITASTGKFDAYGRPLEQTDAAGAKSTTEYAPATGVQPSKVTSANPKGQKSVATMDGLRGVPVEATDTGGRTTFQHYNALGQLTAAWRPGRDKSKPADVTFEYLTRNDAPTTVRSNTLVESGKYRSAVTLYDGLLRERQTQTAAHGGSGRVVKDTFRDSHGRAYKANAEYFNADGVATSLLVVADNQVPNQTVTEFDGKGRTTASITKSKNVEKWRASTTHGGDWSAVVAPEGGGATLAVRNAHGKIVEFRQYKDGKPEYAASADKYEATKYTYDVADQLTKLVDAEGNTWTTEYDLRGHAVKTTDPDKGTVRTTYRPDGKVATITDSRGQVLVHDYDEISRRTALRKDSATGEKLAEWTYDTLPGGTGKLSSSTRYHGGQAYTTAVKGYDNAGRALGSVITVPSAEGKLAGSYTFESTYTPNTGLAATTSFPAGGGLGAETVQHDYTEYGLATGLSNGEDVYSLGTEYSPFGEVLQTVLGDIGARAVQTYTYEEHTRRLATMINDREADGPQTIDSKVYGHDPAGNIIKIRNDRDDKTVEDTQCYTYDFARRLTNAWTATDDCAAKPSADAKPKVGGVDAYWNSYTYDAVGNRATEIQHDAAGDLAKDIKRTSAYPKAGEARPHALDKVDIAGPSARSDSFEYDAAGNTTRRVTADGDQKVTWDAEGRMASSTTDGKVSTFVYDADGSRLLRKDADKVTLYLGSQELTLTTSDSKVSGVRYYKAGEATVVATSDGTLSFQLSDHHGTGEVSVDAFSMEYSRRGFTPFGSARGPQPADGEWAGEKGYVGGTEDASTGLTHLGAREYDAANGLFISVDPVMDPTDPQQMNAYSYASNSPVTGSDPTGQYYSWSWWTQHKNNSREAYNAYVKQAKKAESAARLAQAKAAGGGTLYAQAWMAAFGPLPAGAQRFTDNVGAGPDRGVIVVSLYIHTPDAMLGALKGDNRSTSLDPAASYRMLLFWDTKSGDVSFTVAASHTTPKAGAGKGANLLAPNMTAEEVPSRMLAANNIWGNEGSASLSTLLAVNTIEASKTESGSLKVAIHAVQPLMPVGSVDAHLTITPNGSSVTARREGDAYPDMQITQYRQAQPPNIVAKDGMASTTGFPAMPLWPNVDRTWIDGTCVKGCG